MPHEFIEKRRRLKRLKRLPALTETAIKAKGGRGNTYQYTRTGIRDDLGVLFRSAWESNFARILTIHGIDYEFEPRTFPFPIKRGTKSYTPDFFLPRTKEWVEVKGYFDDKSRIKLKRFSIYEPEEFKNLWLIISKHSRLAKETADKLGIKKVIYYEDLRNEYKPAIKNWEGK